MGDSRKFLSNRERTLRAAILVTLALRPMSRGQLFDLLAVNRYRLYDTLAALKAERAVFLQGGRSGAAQWRLSSGLALMSVRRRKVARTVTPKAVEVPQSTSWWLSPDFYTSARARAKERGWS